MKQNAPIFIGLLVALSLAPIAARAETDAPVTKTQQRAFQLGLMLGFPQGRTVKFLHNVKGLRLAPDEPAGLAQTARLSKEAAELRALEARCSSTTERLLKEMGAPPALCTWAGQSSKAFSSPVIMSPEAKPYAKKQPNVAAILATIDEAEDAAKAESTQWKSIEVWLRLSYGKDSLWAMRTGDLAASLHAPNADELRLDHLPTYADVLKTAAPANTPPNVIGALDAVSIPALLRSRDAAKAAGKPAADTEAVAIMSSAALIDTYGARDILKNIEGP